MKKGVLTMILAGTMMLAGGCTNNKSTPAAAEETNQTTKVTELTEEETKAETETKKKGVLTMVTQENFPPYEYYIGDTLLGMDVDLGSAIAQELNMEFKVETMPKEAVEAALMAGKGEIALGDIREPEEVEEEGSELITYSEVYRREKQVLLTKEESPIEGLDSLGEKRVGVRKKSQGEVLADQLEESTIARYDKLSRGVQALLEDKIDAIIVEEDLAEICAKEHAGLKILNEIAEEQSYAIAIDNSNPELAEQIKEALKSIEESGELSKIIEKHINLK